MSPPEAGRLWRPKLWRRRAATKVLAPGVSEFSHHSGPRSITDGRLRETHHSVSVSSFLDEAVVRESDISDSQPSLAEALAPLHGPDVHVEDHYEITQAVGGGGCGSVHVAVKRDTQQLYAIKTTPADDPDAMRMLRREFACHKACHDHPNICRVYEAFEMKGRRGLMIVMELCPGGSFIDWLQSTGPCSESEVAIMLEKLCSAVFYMHQRGYVHRDIKPDNIMIDSAGEPKLIDFGFARQVEPGAETMTGRYGTLSYQAPELLLDSRGEGYDSSVDLWALGVTAYTLLYNRKPFEHKDRTKKRDVILAAKLVFRDELRQDWGLPRLSPLAKDFIARLIEKDPHRRMSASAALRHPWIRALHPAPPCRRLSDPLVASFRAFSEASALGKFVMEVIAFQESPLLHEEIELFSSLDADASGTISLDEWCQAYAEHPEVPPTTARRIFQELDVSHTGQLDLSEFLAASLYLRLHGKQPHGRELFERMVRAAFQLLDKDHDGFLTREDIVATFKRRLSEAQIDELFPSRFERLSADEMCERLDHTYLEAGEASCPEVAINGRSRSIPPVRRVRTASTHGGKAWRIDACSSNDGGRKFCALRHLSLCR